MPEDTPNPLDDLFPEESTEGEQPKPTVEVKPVKAPVAPPVEPVKSAPQPPVIEPLREEGRFGKFMRNALRLFTLSLVMFAAGFLVSYFLLYQPTMKQLDTRSVNLQTTSGELETLKADYTELKGQYDGLLADATKIEARASLALALRSLELAKLGIEKKNNVVVRNQLQLTRKYVDELLPYLVGAGEQDMATELGDLMQSAETELVRDPQAIGPAVETLMDALESLKEVISLK
jgi:F0F1-type ATP synthase membrane subunit b/b'